MISFPFICLLTELCKDSATLKGGQPCTCVFSPRAEWAMNDVPLKKKKKVIKQKPSRQSVTLSQGPLTSNVTYMTAVKDKRGWEGSARGPCGRESDSKINHPSSRYLEASVFSGPWPARVENPSLPKALREAREPAMQNWALRVPVL